MTWDVVQALVRLPEKVWGVGKAEVAVKGMGNAATVTPAIKTALGASKAMAGSNINVDTTATQVTLSGTVKSPQQKSMAASIAKAKMKP